MAERTGLEPAAFAVTGRRYNQLNYRSEPEPVSWLKNGQQTFSTQGCSRDGGEGQPSAKENSVRPNASSVL